MVYAVDDGDYYGFDYVGNWFCNNFFIDAEEILANKHISYATVEEVKTKLFNEAEKRGFVKGAKFVSIADNSNEYTYNYPLCDEDAVYLIWNSTGGQIYNHGVWAEVIKKIAPEDNNGWTKIYDESDLPKEDGAYEVLLNKSKTPFLATLTEITGQKNRISHWKKPTLLPIE